MSRYIGEIILFSGKTIPEGFMPCDGRLLEVQKWQALYSIIGNIYGGDNRKFALPDLRSRIPIGYNHNNRLEDGRSSNELGHAGGPELAKAVAATQPMEVAVPRSPYLTLRYLIVVEGDYPLPNDDQSDQ